MQSVQIVQIDPPDQAHFMSLCEYFTGNNVMCRFTNRILQCLSFVLIGGGLFYTETALAQDPPYCLSETSDADGDSWGWENSASCLVRGSFVDLIRKGFPACTDSVSDPDGDGYGFEQGRSCAAPPEEAGNAESGSAESSSVEAMPECVEAGTDPDGDGFGFEGGRSCRVAEKVVDDRPACSSDESDPDGDGFGWENNATCIVVSDSETSQSKADSTATIDEITDVVLVTGQSNVLGSNTAFDSTLDQPSQRVFAYTNEGWQIADLHQVWDRFQHPGNQSLTTAGREPTNSFAFHFGKTLATLDTRRVPAFIVVPAPGRGISAWDAGTDIYNLIDDKVTRALADIPHKYSIDAVLWHQGENDWQYEGTNDANPTGFTSEDSHEYRNYYQIKLDALIANFRNEEWGARDTAFICGETRRAEGVNRRLMALNSDNDPGTACVPATDLPKRADDPYGSHFSAEGLRTLGKRYAEAYIAIISNK